LAVVIETTSLSEAELSAYCRQKGLYSEQVQRWKEACLHGTALQEGQEKAAQKQQRDARKTIKKLKAVICNPVVQIAALKQSAYCTQFPVNF